LAILTGFGGVSTGEGGRESLLDSDDHSLLGGLGLCIDELVLLSDEALGARGNTSLISSMLLTNVFKPGSPIDSSLSSKLAMTDLLAELIVILYKDIFLNCCSFFFIFQSKNIER
jgi:hypothetical protein